MWHWGYPVVSLAGAKNLASWTWSSQVKCGAMAHQHWSKNSCVMGTSLLQIIQSMLCLRLQYVNVDLNPLLLRDSEGDDGIWREFTLCLLRSDLSNQYGSWYKKYFWRNKEVGKRKLQWHASRPSCVCALLSIDNGDHVCWFSASIRILARIVFLGYHIFSHLFLEIGRLKPSQMSDYISDVSDVQFGKIKRLRGRGPAANNPTTKKRPEDVPNASGWYGRLLVQKLTVLLFLGGFAIRQRVGRSMLRIHRGTPCWAHRASSEAIRLFLTR